MGDPLSIVTGVAQLVQTGARGVEAAERLFPLYGRFMERFERGVADWNIDLSDPFATHCYRAAEFRSVAIGYLVDRRAGAAGLRAYLERWFPGGAVDELLRIAERSAAVLEQDPRLVEVETRQLLRDEIDGAVSAIAQGQSGTDAAVFALGRTTAVQHRDVVERIDALASRIGDVPKRQTAPAGTGMVTSTGESAVPGAVPDAFERLAESDESAAESLRALWAREGVAGFIKTVGEPATKHAPRTWQCVGRILATHGLYQQSELAYLSAAAGERDPDRRARFLVGAARSAEARGADSRVAEHLASAHLVAPESPALLITEARRLDAPDARIERLEGVASEDPLEQAHIHQTRGEAYIAKRHFANARDELAHAEALAPSDPLVRELSAIVPWYENHLRAQDGEPVDPTSSALAAETFAKLGREAGQYSRTREKVQLLGRAVECHVIAGNLAAAEQLVEELTEQPVDNETLAAAIGRAALLCGRQDLVERLIPAETTDAECRIVLASAWLEQGAEGRWERVDALLLDLTHHPEETVARNAAVAILRLASMHVEAPWDPHAASLLLPDHAVLVSTLHAVRLANQDELDEAERVLLPHAASLSALSLLRDIAVAQERWDAAVDRSDALVRRRNDPTDRLGWAQALHMAGRNDEAANQYLRVARDPQAHERDRDQAFSSAMPLVVDTRDVVSMADFTSEWLREVPASVGARWNLAYARTRLDDLPAAFDLIGTERPPDLSRDQAHLLAEVLGRHLAAAESLPRIIELSDHFEQADEPLERAVFSAGLGAEELDPEIAARVTDTLATFTDRFPGSTAVKTFEAPDSPEKLIELLASVGQPDEELVRDAVARVESGRGPVAMVADATGRGSLETWSRLESLPLGFLRHDEEELQDLAAAAAVGGAAVWDQSSLYTVSCLPETARRAVQAALPGGMVAVEVVADAVSADTYLGEVTAYVGASKDGTGWWHDVSPDDEAARRGRISLARQMAQVTARRVPKPEREASDSSLSRWSSVYDTSAANRGRALNSIVATMLVALKEQRAIFTDDRWVRAAAHQEGLRAFGTLALLAALREKDLLTAEDHERSRRALAGHRSWGVGLTSVELRRAARELDYRAVGPLAGALVDRAAWQANRDGMWTVVLELLVEADEHSGDCVGDLLRLAAEGYAASYEGSSLHAEAYEVFLALALSPGDATSPAVPRSCFERMASEARRDLGLRGEGGKDPVIGAALRIVDHASALDEDERPLPIGRMLAWLSPTDRRRLSLAIAQRSATNSSTDPPATGGHDDAEHGDE